MAIFHSQMRCHVIIVVCSSSHYEMSADQQIYLRSEKNWHVEGPTVQLEICVENSLFEPKINVAKRTVLIDYSKSGIGKQRTRN